MTLPSPVTIQRSAIAIAGLAAAVWILPSPVPRPDVPEPSAPVADSEPDGVERAAALLEFEDIVRRNAFVAERRTADPPAPTPVAASESAAPPAPSLRLYGVARGPQGAVALIDADPNVPGAEIYRLGDRVGGYRLETIDATFVVLVGPNGPRTLRLALPQERSP